MAIHPEFVLKPPAKPTDLEVIVRKDKSLVITWRSTDSRASLFELRICYYPFEGPIIRDSPTKSSVHEVCGAAKHVLHPGDLPKAQAWVVKISLKAKSEGGESESAECQVTWEGELSDEESKNDLRERAWTFDRQDLCAFMESKKKHPEVLVLGPQHHGKSSFVNHVRRCLRGDLSLNDELDTAPAGAEERTIEAKRVSIEVGSSSRMTFIDTPAFSTMNADTIRTLQTLLSSSVHDGARRLDLARDELSWVGAPPHAMILVISLCHWRDQADEMRTYLEKMARVLKNASGGTVEFPYVVAATHCDKFLMECQQDDPCKELDKAVRGIKRSALTNHVYAIRNCERESAGNARNNKATFDLLSQLLTKARNQDTARSQTSFVQRWFRRGRRAIEENRHFLGGVGVGGTLLAVAWHCTNPVGSAAVGFLLLGA